MFQHKQPYLWPWQALNKIYCACDCTRLQESLIAQQTALDCAQAQQAAAVEQLKLTALHSQQLQQQAIDACRGALAGEHALINLLVRPHSRLQVRGCLSSAAYAASSAGYAAGLQT
jgi:hypothetical protein